MRKEFGKLIRETFACQLNEHWPAMLRWKLKSPYILPGDCVFVVPSTSATVLGFVVLVPDHQGRDEFTLEIGWSTKGRFPELPRRPFGRASNARTEFQHDEFTCRLYTLWSNTDDYWWGQNQAMRSLLNGQIPASFEEIQSKTGTEGPGWQTRAIANVTDAVEQLCRHGVPYLDEFFACRSVTKIQPQPPT